MDTLQKKLKATALEVAKAFAKAHGVEYFDYDRETISQLCRQWGIPNAFPSSLSGLPFGGDFGCYFVDDHNDGKVMAIVGPRPLDPSGAPA